MKFHDIKPPPVFSPLPDWLLTASISLILLITIGLLFWFLNKKKQKKLSETMRKSPHEKLTEGLSLLAKVRTEESISIRDLAASLSILLREFIESTLHIPCIECTRAEVIHNLQHSHKIKSAPSITTKKIIDSCNSVLRFFDLTTFSDDSENKVTLKDSRFDKAFSTIPTIANSLMNISLTPAEVKEKKNLEDGNEFY